MLAAASTATPLFRGRIGCDTRSGYYAAPHRYRLHLSLTCPYCLQIAVTHSLLGLGDVLPVTLLPSVPDGPDGSHAALRPLYEASAHQHPGPAAAPVLSDGWTGRIVSTHTPDIVRDLAHQFGGRGPELQPYGTEAESGAIGRLCEEGINEAAQRAGQPGIDDTVRDSALMALFGALDALEQRLALQDHVLGSELTTADVQVWVTLLQLDTVHRRHLDAAAVDRIAGHPRLWAYARRLTSLPAFGSHLDLDGIDRRHDAHCQGLESAGAAVQIVDWAAAYVPEEAATAGEQPG
ncbi:glutathione S-transferase C-terminal domain-containing protein [Streptomyces sp. PSKA54]|uniref:Glutathione S-transferase C-terminal domain-containing protein n=1 Tax=Streptomyces himalayensis subsp. aureolus TaxID=2758039 RepID=A0A7W2D2T1_9ACTN|nr:glutathione S-transferase C-terminal domain-containing protein [Streptomyces himalayensis]MBA4863718.1 glutathione S-transferase C-terminal domain-containing protein [Streptomyces himalayensis subsp. aureolus]